MRPIEMDAPDAACRATSGIQPLVGDVKILLPNEKSARKVRHLRPRRNFQSNPGPSNSHEIRLPHRCTAALAQARCGPARVRTARCADAPNQQAELFRHHHHRLILSHRGDRSPRSPEATRTPSGSCTRGRFRFGARTKELQDQTRLHRAPEASGHCWSEAGKPAKAHGCAVPGCFGTGGKRMRSHTDWRFRREVGGANAEHRRTIHSGTGLYARPVRAALPWRMPGIGRRCSTKWR